MNKEVLSLPYYKTLEEWITANPNSKPVLWRIQKKKIKGCKIVIYYLQPKLVYLRNVMPENL